VGSVPDESTFVAGDRGERHEQIEEQNGGEAEI
jgi:hypothetical protein